MLSNESPSKRVLFDARRETILRKGYECEKMFSDCEVQIRIKAGGSWYGYQSPNWVAPTEVPPLSTFHFWF
jgi:hypothetical protein